MASKAAAAPTGGGTDPTINLKVNIDVPQVSSLTTVVEQLEAMKKVTNELREAYRGIYNPTTGLMQHAGKKPKEWETWVSSSTGIAQQHRTVGGHTPQGLAAALFGFTPDQVKKSTDSMKWQLEVAHREIARLADSMFKGGWNGRWLSNEQSRMLLPGAVSPIMSQLTAGEAQLQRMLTGFTSGTGIGFGGKGGGGGGTAGVAGTIALTIPAAQIKADVSGDVIVDLTGHIKGVVTGGVPAVPAAPRSPAAIPGPSSSTPAVASVRTASGIPSGARVERREFYDKDGNPVRIENLYRDAQGRQYRTRNKPGEPESAVSSDITQPAARALAEANSRFTDITRRAQAQLRGLAPGDYAGRIAIMEAQRAQLEALRPQGLAPFDADRFQMRQQTAIMGSERAAEGFRVRQTAAEARQREREANAWHRESERARRSQDAFDSGQVNAYGKESDRAAREQDRGDRAARAFNRGQVNAYGRESDRARREDDRRILRNVSLSGAAAAEARMLADGWSVSGEQVFPGARSNRVVRSFSRGDQRQAITRFYGLDAIAGAGSGFDLLDPSSYAGLTASGAALGAPRGVRAAADAKATQPGGYRNKDWFSNTGNVTAWASSVWALYGASNAAQRSLMMLVETGSQTARLEQVFSKIGGTTREMRDDLLAAAAANGRMGSEAMEAAVSWARLGLSRRGLRTATNVSLMAANVAEMTAGEATTYLQAVTQPFGLQPHQMPTMLAELNEISNRRNAAPRDILIGLSRTASVAKQSGMDLPQLMGMLGATIGTTGQSGQNIGNAMKSFIIALSNPDVQGYLKNAYQVDVTKPGGGDTKPMPEILDDLFVAYSDSKGRTNQDRMGMLTRVANKTQASRVAAMMDSYVTGARLAINAQLDLNSAQEENARILNTLKAQLQGVITEYQRFITIRFSGGKHWEKWADQLSESERPGLAGAMRAFTPEGATINALRSLRGGLALMNTDKGSVVSGLMLSAAGAMMGGALFRKIGDAWKDAGKPEAERRAGILTNTMAKARGVLLPKGGWDDQNPGILKLPNPIVGDTGDLSHGISTSQRWGMRARQTGRRMIAGAASLAGPTALFAGSMVAMEAAVWGLSAAVEYFGLTSNKATDNLEEMTKRVEQYQEAANAGASAIRLYATVGRATANASQQDREKWATEMGQLGGSYSLTADELTKLRSGDASWQGSANLRARSTMYENRDNAMIMAQRRKDAALSEAKRLEGWGKTSRADEFRAMAAGYDKQLYQFAAEDEEGIPDGLLSNPQKMAMARRQGALGSIDLVFGGLGSRSVAEQEANTFAGLMARRGVLASHGTQLESLLSKEMVPAEAKAQIARQESEARLLQLREQLANAARFHDGEGGGASLLAETQAISAEITKEQQRLAGLKATRSGDIPFIKKLQSQNSTELEATDVQISEQAARMAGAIARTRMDWSTTQIGARLDKYGAGTNPAEEAMNRQLGLANELTAAELAYQNAVKGSAEEQEALLRIKETTSRLTQADLDILTAQDRIAKSQLELASRAQRELRGGLIAGGPDELMKFAAAWRIGHDSRGGKRNIGIGELMTYDTDLKSALFKVRPDLSPEGYELSRGSRQAKERIEARGGERGVRADMDAVLGRNLTATARLGEGGFWNEAMSLQKSSLQMSEAANTFDNAVRFFQQVVWAMNTTRSTGLLPANAESTLTIPASGFSVSDLGAPASGNSGW